MLLIGAVLAVVLLCICCGYCKFYRIPISRMWHDRNSGARQKNTCSTSGAPGLAANPTASHTKDKPPLTYQNYIRSPQNRRNCKITDLVSLCTPVHSPAATVVSLTRLSSKSVESNTKLISDASGDEAKHPVQLQSTDHAWPSSTTKSHYTSSSRTSGSESGDLRECNKMPQAPNSMRLNSESRNKKTQLAILASFSTDV